jgi:hypothetical protein
MSLVHRQRIVRSAALGLLLVFGAACTESDELLVEDVGVTRLFLVDPSLRNQSIFFTPLRNIQVAEWRISAATLDIDGAQVPLVTEDCTLSDTSQFSPVAEGDCDSGIVIEASNQPFTALLILTIEGMEMRRGKPVDLDATEDYDGDGVDNPDDNCPLVANADQADSNRDEIGNACATVDGFRDSDADGIFDGLDNCVEIPNSGQQDSNGPLGGLVPDGIGDACEEQVATVASGGSTSFELILGPALLDQPVEGNSFLTVVFDSDVVFGLDGCDWDTLTCTLDPDAVEFCSNTSLTNAVNGC